VTTERQKVVSGELYRPGDPELQAESAAAKAWMVRYDAVLANSPAARRGLLRERLGGVSEGAVIRPPFFYD
jgi:maltose O-acetyltransferase